MLGTWLTRTHRNGGMYASFSGSLIITCQDSVRCRPAFIFFNIAKFVAQK